MPNYVMKAQKRAEGYYKVIQQGSEHEEIAFFSEAHRRWFIGGDVRMKIDEDFRAISNDPVELIEMTTEEKVNYFRIACALQQIVVDNRVSEQLLITHSVILLKGLNFTLEDAVRIQSEIERRYGPREPIPEKPEN